MGARLRLGFIFFIVSGLGMGSALAQHQLKQPIAPETLYGIQLGQKNLTVQVRSNGCTRSEHFEIKVNNSALDIEAGAVEQALSNEVKGTPQVTIERLKADRCRRMPFVSKVSLPMPLLDGSFQLMNPLKVWPRLQRQ